MKILPEDKVTVKQVKDAYYKHLVGIYGGEMNRETLRNDWHSFWKCLEQEIKKDGK